MTADVATMAQGMVREAATPVAPGETVKAQLRRAARALGYRDGDWRIRAAWYGEAGAWSAAAFVDLQSRFAAWRQTYESRARAEAAAHIAQLTSIMEALDASDQDIHRDAAAAMQRALHGALAARRPVAPARRGG